MGARTLLKWSKQITPSQVVKLIKAEKDVKKAKLIFDSATAEYGNGFRHDHSTFGVIISKLVSANMFIPAEEMVVRMKEEKCEITEDILLNICKAYGRVHRPLDAIRVFHKMNEFECIPTQKSYITLIDILVEENQLKIAMRFYREMRETGIPHSVVSLNILIKVLCKSIDTINAAIKVFHEMSNRGCEPDSYTYGTLINGLCKVGRVHEAKELFMEMQGKGCSPSVVTYTCLMCGLCQSKNMDEAMGLLEEMKIKGIDPNVFTYSSLMDGFCKVGRSSEALELLEMMVSKHHKPNTITYTTLIDGLCKENKLAEAVEILDRMMLQGLKPDAGLYGKIITGFCDICKFQEAANFLDEMILGGISPSRVTWCLHVKINNTVIRGLCLNGHHHRAFQLYLSVRSRGISIDAETFDSLLKCLCKKRDLIKAARVVDEMVIDGCVPDNGTWSVVVSEFWDRRKVKEAFELILVEVKSDGPSCRDSK